ncbi:host factor-I protein [Alicyclobacillus tolerans]|uniref:RNA-binding protein Hfq n=1 Tax=Alicyclobacillus tolerans TaxID=90970 RepID=A0A1M6X782_9BACL|nr:host factor-I protein [Alicyclobacillus montanus]
MLTSKLLHACSRIQSSDAATPERNEQGVNGVSKQPVNIQDTFLNQVRKEKIPVIVYLVNGFQIRGNVKAFDNFTIVVEADGKQQMIYKHAVSTFIPLRAVNLMNAEESSVSDEN